LKILHLAYAAATTPPVDYGGTERLLYPTLKGQVERGHQVWLHSHPNSKIPGVVTVGCDVDSATQVQQAIDVVKSLKPDIIHDHTQWNGLGFDNTGVRVVRTFHGDPHLKYRSRYGVRKDIIPTFLSAGFAKFYGMPDAIITRMPFTLNPMAGCPFNPDGRASHLLFVGSIADFKGAHIAIRWAEMMDRKLTMMGPCPHNQSQFFKDQIQPSIASKHVTYMGSVKDDVKWKALCEAHALLVPSICEEGLSIVVAEAMLAGCPVLGHPVGGIPETLGDWGGRATYNLTEVVKFDEWLKSRYKPEMARQRVMDLFDVNTCLNRIEEVYRG